MINIAIFFLNLVALIASLTWLLISKGFEPLITSIGLFVSQIIFGKELFKSISLLQLKDVTINIAIMGDKYCGKSVHITSAFNQLQKSADNILFSISDYNTIERVFFDIHSLCRQQWLSVTPTSEMGRVFCYRGTISKKKWILSKRINFSIADYSGEEYETLSNANTGSGWFHASIYFRYVLDSDAIILAIDASAMTSTREPLVHSIDWQVQRQIAALHVYIQESKLKSEGKILIPVCLVIMKSDLVIENERVSIEETYLSELINFCKSKCCKFKLFWVSSTGRIDNDGVPPRPLKPQNVAKPIMWIVSNL